MQRGGASLRGALILPTALGLGLAAWLLIPEVRATPGLFWAFAGASMGVLGWTAWLQLTTVRRGTTLALDLRVIRPHWIQLLAQGTVLVWWGWHVRAVYEFIPFILAQLMLAVAVEALFAWTRRGRHTLGFGPVPVVFSLNLFLWFHLDWFFFQLAMVVLVYCGKEFIRWRVGGRSRHIFNPSAFALSVASLALIATGATEITQGIEIAQSQYIPPHIFLVIFLAALPGQLLFGVATMTLPAVLTIWGFSAAYLAINGEFFFFDAYIPIAVFLGLHLLFTDPATSPRSELGRVLFAVLYGTGVIASVFALEAIGAPPFYDKLLPVPILNLLTPTLDRVADALAQRIGLSWAAAKGMVPLRRRVATVGLWAAIFAGLSFGGALGDSHPGQYYPFWREACERGSARACNYSGIMLQGFCDRGSGWACNEFGVLLVGLDGDYRGAEGEFARSCQLEYAPGCLNREGLALRDPRLAEGTDAYARSDPPLTEWPLVLRGSKGPVRERDPEALRLLGCERGWPEICG